MSVPSNLIPTTITQLPEYTGSGTGGYMPYVIDGRTYKVLFSNIASVGAVPSSRVIAAGTGLTGGGSLAADRVIAIANGGVGFDQLATSGATAGTYGSGTTVPVLTVDVKGRVTAATTTPVVISGYVPEGRSVIAGTGLTGGGTLTSNVTLAVNFASSDPQALGTATAGVSTAAARGDHVHPAVNLSDTSQTQGALPLGRGGTGDALSPVAGAVVYSTGTRFALTALGLPGQVLVSNGTSAPSWLTVSGVGTVTSVNVSGGTTGLTFTGGPITSAGTITAGGTLGVANGGTGVTSSTGTGSVVLSTSPTLVTPALGVASATSIATGVGAVGSPSHTFTGDTTTGMWSPAGSTIAFSTAGIERMRIRGNGRVGVNVDPAAQFQVRGPASDTMAEIAVIQSINVAGTDTHGLQISADAVGNIVQLASTGNNTGGFTFLTGSAERMRILSTGEVCVGRTNSLNTGVLSVLGTGTQAITAQVTVDGNSLIQGYNSSTGLAFQILGTGQGYYAGNLGIGTTSPAARIHTNGGAGGINAVFESNTAADTRIEFRNNATRAGYLYWDANEVRLLADPTRAVTLFTNGVERMRITNGGDVGVGTTSPGGLLGIAGTTVIGNQATTGTDGTLRLVTAGGVTFIQSGQNRTTASAAPLAFTDMNGSSEWMRLTATGNLGIGITAPGSRLDVAGALMVNGTLSTGQTNKAAFQYGSNETSIRSYGATANSGFITFRTGGGGSDTERMRITPTGLVGIGATPSASRLEVNGSISNTLGSGGTLTLYETDATRANQLITAADASGSYLNATFSTGGSAVLRLQTAGTERLRVKANGQVRFVPLAAAPGSPEAGDVYYDSTTNKLRCYNGTTWNDLF
jgi:hypothetical protein